MPQIPLQTRRPAAKGHGQIGQQLLRADAAARGPQDNPIICHLQGGRLDAVLRSKVQEEDADRIRGYLEGVLQRQAGAELRDVRPAPRGRPRQRLVLRQAAAAYVRDTGSSGRLAGGILLIPRPEHGLLPGPVPPCVFRHPSTQLVVSVHGDDFTIAGACEDIDWFDAGIQEHYECTLQPRIGPGPEDAREGLVLNRVVRWTTEGVEYEADPRQAEKLIAECGLTGANTVATPGQRLAFAELEKDLPLENRLHTAFRGAAARANYLAADRVDLQFAAKEVCRWMSSPTEQSWAALKRLCRYLSGLPRMVYTFNFQEAKGIEVYTDTDWAGCPRTRKSTSGGLVMLGQHLIKSWSSTQASISLSSGEAEFNGVVRGAGIGLGYQSLVKDLGQHLPVRVWTDSSAAIGVCSRQGLGKLRHLDTHTLWVQQAIRAQKIVLCKVDGETNPADLLTKHSLSRERLITRTTSLDCRFRGGRASLAPKMRETPSTRVTMAEASGSAANVLDDASDEQEIYALHYIYRPNEDVVLEVRDMRSVRVKGELQLPHLQFEPEEVHRRHPPLRVPEAVDAGDPLDPEDDALLRAGRRIVSELMAETARQGRRRRLQAGSDE